MNREVKKRFYSIFLISVMSIIFICIIGYFIWNIINDQKNINKINENEMYGTIVCDEYCINQATIYKEKYGTTEPVWWVNSNASEITIYLEIANSEYEEHELKSIFDVKLKEGINTIVIGKNTKTNEDIFITVNKTNYPKLLTDRKIDLDEMK